MMKLDDYFFLLGFSYLKADQSQRQKIRTSIANHPYNYQSIKDVTKLSLAGVNEESVTIPFFQWAEELSQKTAAEGLIQIQVSSSGVSQILSIQTQQKQRHFLLASESAEAQNTDQTQDSVANKNPNLWQMSVFTPTEDQPKFVKVSDPSTKDLEILMNEYKLALENIRRFAIAQKTGFVEVFEVSLLQLQKEITSFNFESELRKLNFPERLVSFYLNESLNQKSFRDLGFQDKEARCLSSLSHSDVFGGMGSWNDLGFYGETPVDIEFSKVSNDLLSSRKNLKNRLLLFNPLVSSK